MEAHARAGTPNSVERKCASPECSPTFGYVRFRNCLEKGQRNGNVLKLLSADGRAELNALPTSHWKNRPPVWREWFNNGGQISGQRFAFIGREHAPIVFGWIYEQ